VVKYTVATSTQSTIAGISYVAGSTGDYGLAVKAKLNSPTAIAVDFLGNVYIADNNNYRIRRIDWGPGKSLNITTVAGSGVCCWSGVNNEGVLLTKLGGGGTGDTYGLAVTAYGTMYLTSQYKYAVRALPVPPSGLSPDGACGSCYLPSGAGSLCCQTCAQVKAAYVAMGLTTYNAL